jgi:hypothetical protein
VGVSLINFIAENSAQRVSELPAHRKLTSHTPYNKYTAVLL